MNIQQVFAENIRAYRKQARITQEELAEKSGLHRTYIGGIEQQRINVSLKNIEKIAKALHIDPALLLMHNSAITRAETLEDHAFARGDYALCAWTDAGISIEPIRVDDEKLTISILCALINDGQEDNLLEAYEKTRMYLLDYFRQTRKNDDKETTGRER